MGQLSWVHRKRKSWSCSRRRVGVASHIASGSGATHQGAPMHAARWRASFVVFGRTSRRTLVATTVGLRTPARCVVVCSTHLTRQAERLALFAVELRFAGPTECAQGRTKKTLPQRSKRSEASST